MKGIMENAFEEKQVLECDSGKEETETDKQ
jgi:hypothetical protein